MTNSNFIPFSRTETQNALWSDRIAVFIKFRLIILKIIPLGRGARPVFRKLRRSNNLKYFAYQLNYLATYLRDAKVGPDRH